MAEQYSADLREREYQRRFAMLLATAWRDQHFIQRLLKEPQKCFEEFGISLPKGRQVVVHIDTPERLNVVIPERPQAFDEAIRMEAADNCWKSSKCWNLCD
jgi:Nitrile hydratase, alpha chain